MLVSVNKLSYVDVTVSFPQKENPIICANIKSIGADNVSVWSNVTLIIQNVTNTTATIRVLNDTSFDLNDLEIDYIIV